MTTNTLRVILATTDGTGKIIFNECPPKGTFIALVDGERAIVVDNNN